jgi:UDP-N-acetylmuramoylalanine--D-glutamate ligase
MLYDFEGKRIAVVGIARSGMAAADVLSRRGASVILYDGKSADQLVSQLEWAEINGIQCVTAAEAVGPADIAIISPGVRITSPIVRSILDQKIELWGEIEAAYRISQAPILAVTGTNGKTTTALLLAEMLRIAGKITYAGGNIAAGNIAQPLIEAAESASADDAIVAEISSFQLESIVEFRPSVAAILNITPDHQDRQSWKDYVASKWRLFEKQRDDDTAVLSCAVPRPAGQPSLPPNVVYFDDQPMPGWIDQILLPGAHNRSNILAASAMAHAFGVPESSIKEASLTFKGVVHRLEYVGEIDDVKYINNSMCTNNAAFASSLEAITAPKIVIAGGVFKGGDMTPIANAISNNNVKLLVTFGRSGPVIADVVRSNSDVKVAVTPDLQSALAVSSSEAVVGDTIILNPGCASFDQFKDFEHRGDTFKSIVLALRKVTSK